MLNKLKKILRYFWIIKHKKIKKTRPKFRFRIYNWRVVTLTWLYAKKNNKQNKRLVYWFFTEGNKEYLRWQSMSWREAWTCTVATFYKHFDIPTIIDIFKEYRIPENIDYVEDPELAEILFANLNKYLDDRKDL
jgi:hypothetical protein